MTREGCCRASKQRRSLRRKLSHGGQRQHQLRESSRASYDSQRHNTAVGCGTQLIEASWIALLRLPPAGPKRYTDHGTTSATSEIFIRLRAQPACRLQRREFDSRKSGNYGQL